MKKYLLMLFALSAVTFFACDKDDDPAEPESTYEYHAHVHQPQAGDKMMGDTLPIHVVFESHTGETIHHINVRIFNKADSTQVYSKPDVAHLHETSGMYTYSDQYALSGANGFSPGVWIFEAKVWGHEAGLEEASEQVEFTIQQ